MQDEDGADLVSVGEAAKALGVSAKSLSRWAKDGLVTSWRTPGGRKRGGQYRFNVEVLRRELRTLRTRGNG